MVAVVVVVVALGRVVWCWCGGVGGDVAMVIERWWCGVHIWFFRCPTHRVAPQQLAPQRAELNPPDHAHGDRDGGGGV